MSPNFTRQWLLKHETRIHWHILWWSVVLSTCAVIPTSLERPNDCCWQMGRRLCGGVITTVPLLKPEVKPRKWELRLWYRANMWACWLIPVMTGSRRRFMSSCPSQFPYALNWDRNRVFV
jgi:hypothetical protein